MRPLEDINPLLPAGYDAVWTIAIVAAAAVVIVAIVWLARVLSRR
jgi:hypothetical protein